MLGPVATSICVLAVAAIGLMMLDGRIEPRRAATVIVGCFIVAGAQMIATGIQDFVRSAGAEAASPDLPSQTAPPAAVFPPRPHETDPFAGASVPARR